MRLHLNIAAGRNSAWLLAVCLLACACRSSPNSTPIISFSKVPPADVGGPNETDTIVGRVTDVRSGQQIVLYAWSQGKWWVQPFTERPFTKIQNDSTWKSETHLGSEYAALLVEPGYTPSDTADSLPPTGAGVVAEAVVKGVGPAPSPTPIKKIHFSGYDWTVTNAASFRGGTGFEFIAANAWTDEKGALHLRITKGQAPGSWNCAEVRLTRSLGYGTYVFVVRDATHIEPSAVLTLFAWDDLGTEQKRRELDVEISRWGVEKNQNAQYVVQPYYIPANVDRFVAPAGVVTHSFRWEPGEVTFSTAAGTSGATVTHLVNKHVFTSGVPTADGELVHMNFYVFGMGKTPMKDGGEIVIEKFEYLP